MLASAVTRSLDDMQARWQHGYWVPDMSVKCFAGWHLKLSAGEYAHDSVHNLQECIQTAQLHKKPLCI